MKKLLFGILLMAIVVGLPLLAMKSNQLPEEVLEANAEVKVPVMEDSGHRADVSDVIYNSNPPTSGPHFADWHRDWAFYDEEQPIGGLVHNMEHGGIVLFYDPEIDEVLKDELRDYVDDTFKIIASPRDGMEAPVVLVAWGVYEEFEDFDVDRFERFYRFNLNNAPENVYP